MRGIYIIVNDVNNKVYVGKSENLANRITTHLKTLSKGKNRNKHLQNAFDFYGGSNFYIDIIEILNEDDDINSREMYWINYYQSHKREFGYNHTKGGDGGNSYVDCMTEKEKKIHSKIMSDNKKGDKNPIYNKHCYTNGFELRYLSDDEAEKYEKAGWYKGIPDSIREKQRGANSKEKNGFYGKKHTKDTKEKLSKNRSGDKNWNFGRVIYHKNDIQKYIKEEEIIEYEKDGWVRGISPSVKEKISITNNGRKRSVPNKTSIIYEYNNTIFYGWRKLREYLILNGYNKISETSIVKLSNGLHVKGYEDLFGKIKIINKEV